MFIRGRLHAALIHRWWLLAAALTAAILVVFGVVIPAVLP